MKDHGYKGAFEMSASIDYLLAYDATTNYVSNQSYRSIYNGWVKDKTIKDFLLNNNPWCLRDIAQRFIEASNRDLWSDAEDKEINEIKKLITEAERIIEIEDFS